MSHDTQPLDPNARMAALGVRYDDLRATRNAAWWARFNALSDNDTAKAALADDEMARLDVQIAAVRREMVALIRIGGAS